MRFKFILSAIAMCGLSACGGGTQVGGAAGSEIVIGLDTGTSGWADSGGFAVSGGGVLPIGDAYNFEGETKQSTQFLLLSFPIGEVLAGAQIVSVTLHTNQVQTEGGPFVSLGPVVLDHVDPAMTTDTIFNDAAIQLAFGVLSNDSAAGPREVDVTSQVLADIAAERKHTKFRVRHVVLGDEDEEDDLTHFETTVLGESDPSTKTYLRVVLK